MKKPRKQSEIQQLKFVKNLALDAYARGRSRADGDREPAFDPAVLWKVRRLLKEVTESDLDERFVDLLRTLARHREPLKQGVMVWIDLIEALVYNAEQRYSAEGRGHLKSSEVKSVVRYLIRAQKFNIPNVPDFLEPVVIEVVVDWTVDAICRMANKHGVFEEVPHRRSIREMLLWPFHLLWRIARPLVNVLGRFASRIWLSVRYPVRLSPMLRDALAEVERHGLIHRQQEFVAELVQVKAYIGRNGEALHAAVELVSLVVEQAEEVAGLDGPGKKAYATDLVLEVLREIGAPEGWIISSLTQVIVDVSIDAIVALFNKWEIFPEGTTPSRDLAGVHAPPRAPRRRVRAAARSGAAGAP